MRNASTQSRIGAGKRHQVVRAAVRDFEKQTVVSVKVAVPTKIGTQPNSTTCSLELLRVLVGIEFLVLLRNLSQKNFGHDRSVVFRDSF